MKKDLSNVTADLSALAQQLPTQKVVSREESEKPGKVTPIKRKTKLSDEPIIQFSFGLRKSVRKELARMASDADMTMRAYVLAALQDKGLKITDDDLADKRRKE